MLICCDLQFSWSDLRFLGHRKSVICSFFYVWCGFMYVLCLYSSDLRWFTDYTDADLR